MKKKNDTRERRLRSQDTASEYVTHLFVKKSEMVSGRKRQMAVKEMNNISMKNERRHKYTANQSRQDRAEMNRHERVRIENVGQN